MGLNERDYARQQYARVARPALPPITKALLVINIAIFIVDMMTRRYHGMSPIPDAPLVEFGGFRVDEAIYHGHIWQFLTFQFLHENVGHILFNMIGVFIFAPYVEMWWGKWRFLAYYLICGAAGALFFTLLLAIGFLPSASVETPLIGASAGIFGLLFAIYRMNPNARVRLWLPPITLTLRTLALVFAGWAVLTILGGMVSPGASLFWNAGGEAGHLGGALMGLFLMWNPWLLGKQPRIREAKILRTNRFRRTSPPLSRGSRDVDDRAAKIDQILEKIRHSGVASLTEEEREILEWAAKIHHDPS